MAKKKVYAVKKGTLTGIFYTWAECEAAVKGYPGAQYKGFGTLEEAKEYLGGAAASAAENAAEQNGKNPADVFSENPADGVLAYVDGSFDQSIGKYSFGCILITPDGKITRKSGNGDNPESLAIRNVAGEMLGAMFAVKWALKKGFRSIELRYDYEGIEKWATGKWRAKNNLTQKYAAYMREHGKYIRISFTKVLAHSGNYYNEEVDQLAKDALTQGQGIPKFD